MNKTEEIIKVAIDGGYLGGARVCYDPDVKMIYVVFPDGTYSEFIKWQETFMNPSFWQAIGKARGWIGGEIDKQESDWGYDFYCSDCNWHAEMKDEDGIDYEEHYKKLHEEYFDKIDGKKYHKNCPTPNNFTRKAMEFHRINLTKSFDDAINYFYELIK